MPRTLDQSGRAGPPRWRHARWLGPLLLLGLTAGSPADRHAAPQYFIQMSDPQFGMYRADSDFVQETANFAFAIASANRLRPAFVIITGDLVNKPGDPAQVAEYHRIAAQLDPSIRRIDVSGNHDVGNIPTPASIAAYRRAFGPDHYTFQAAGLIGIVLNSSLIQAPDSAPGEYAVQERWLEDTLAQLARSGAGPIVVFQHHPWFLATPDEPDQYFNIPLVRRQKYLALFRRYGIRYVFAGHYHQNAIARDGPMEMVTTGPVGKPFGDTRSGFRIAEVTDSGITHEYVTFGLIPARLAPIR